MVINLSQNRNYTKADITAILKKIKSCVKSDRYQISLNESREENQQFINEYNLRNDRQKDILLNIVVEDFCYSSPNKKKEYEHEVLYVFAPQVKLFDVTDQQERVNMYIKFNIIETTNGLMTIVISFHRLNKKIKYCFK